MLKLQDKYDIDHYFPIKVNMEATERGGGSVVNITKGIAIQPIICTILCHNIASWIVMKRRLND